MRLKPETEYQEKMEPNPGEKEAVVKWQENPNEEAEMHSLRACQKEKTSCQEVMKANPEKIETIDCAIAILEQMIAMTKANQEMLEAMDLKANPEELESESEHQGVPKEDAKVKPVRGWKKRHRDQHLTAGRCGEPKKLI
jgi:hypothetical protein